MRSFAGRSRQFLTAMLGEVGIERKEVFITDSVKYCPLKHSNPLSNETDGLGGSLTG